MGKYNKKYPLDSIPKKEKIQLHDEFYSLNPKSKSIEYMNGLRSGRIKPIKLS